MNLMPASFALDHLVYPLHQGSLLISGHRLKLYGSIVTDHYPAGLPEEVSHQRGFLNQVEDITQYLQFN